MVKVFSDIPLHRAAVEWLRSRGAEVVEFDDPDFPNWPEEADGMVLGPLPLDRSALATVRRLKVLAKHGIGLDNVDLDAARERGIRVTRTPGGNAQSVAELTVGLMIAMTRRIQAAEQRIRSGEPYDRLAYRGEDITGKSAGIIALGNIGRRTARMLARGFGMRVLGYDPHLADAAWADVDAAPTAELDRLLAESDVVCVNAPLNDETRGMIGARELALMKPTAYLVNTGRGGIVDEGAVHDALAAGRLAGAALDVLAVEPAPVDHPLFSLPNFVGTRHVGGYSTEALRNIGLTAAGQVLDVLEGREPADSVI